MLTIEVDLRTPVCAFHVDGTRDCFSYCNLLINHDGSDICNIASDEKEININCPLKKHKQILVKLKEK